MVAEKSGGRRSAVATNLIHDRGRGPEIVGTRITVYNLLPDLLDPAVTEAEVCQSYELTQDQVAAARAYVINNFQSVWAKHLEIEARMAAGNPPEVVEVVKKTHADFLAYKEWLAERDSLETSDVSVGVKAETQRDATRFPAFREWLQQRGSRPG
jgi:uncharacterized protein (DUF433 family)